MDAPARALALLKRHGWNATSFQVLEPGYEYWFEDEACVAYVDTGRAWVVAGPPIAAKDALSDVTRRFVSAATRAGRRVCFFGTEKRFQDLTGFPSIHIGEQPVWDPSKWDDTVSRSRSLREQLRRAANKGVTVRAVDPRLLDSDATLRQRVDDLISRWLGARKMAPMGFLVQLHMHSFLDERRLFIAEHEGKLVGLLAAIPVYARDGWFLEDLVRDRAAPNGTAELLVDAAMRAIAADGSRYVTLGMSPLAGDVPGAMRVLRTWARGLYDFEGLRSFKAKLKPDHWEPISLAHPPTGVGMIALVDALRAFANGGLFRFGVDTLMRGPALVIRALAVLLVPWTLVLALAPAERWFPSPSIKLAWIVFDVALAIALFSLSLKYRPWLQTLLASLVTLDVVLTTAQLALFNEPRAHGPLDIAVGVIAIAGPTLAALLLWRGRSHQLREG